MTGSSRSALPPIPADAPVPTAKSRSNGRALFRGALGGGLIGIALAVGATSVDRDGVRRLFAGLEGVPLAPLLIVLAVFLAILAHELGHVVGGLAMRFRFVLLVVGPFKLERGPDDRVRAGFNTSLASSGGLAALHPTDDGNLRRRFAWLVAGGPIASVLLAVAAGVLVWLWPGASPSLARSFVAVLSAMSIAIAVATMVPMRTGYYLTDGARLGQLLRDGPAGDRDAALLRLIAANGSGVPVAEWHADTITQAVQPVDGSLFELQGRSFAYMWAMARGDRTGARAQLERALAVSAGLPALLRTSLEVELAFLDGLDRADRTTLEQHAARWAKPVPGLSPHTPLRVRAALATALGDPTAAREHITAARATLIGTRAGASAGGQWELDRLGEIEARL